MTLRSARDERPLRPTRPLPRTSWGAVGRFGQRFSLKQTSIVTGLLGLVFLVMATSFVAWKDRQVLFAEGSDHAEQSTAYLTDHAKRLFEVSDLALHAASTALVAQSWDDIARSSEVAAGFRRTDEMLPYIDSVFAADAQGNVKVTSLQRPTQAYSVADRSVFKEASRDPHDNLLIGDAIVGRITGRPTFIVARRRNAPDGHFDGIVGVAMTLTYFTDYWQALDKRNDEQIALVRAGGSILARYPEAVDRDSDDRLGAGLVAAVASGSRLGSFDPGPHQMGTYRQVGNLPIYVTVVFRDAVITAQWRASLAHLLPLAGIAVLALLLVMRLALYLARREEAARRQIEKARTVLSAANTRLELHVAARTADLMESNREIQRFAYIVSHDLRAPLVNIMGFTTELQGLRDEVLDAHAPLDQTERTRLRAEFEEAFGFIKSSIDKMDRLIKAILGLSRQGQRVLRPEPLDMDALMRSIADGVAHRVQESGATIRIDPLPTITADRIAVEQIFANLVDNAIKYLRPEVAGVVDIAGTASETTVTITVKDNGRGIDVNDRERVFDLFRRAGKQDQPGEGIGLANVRSIVRRLHGTIALDGVVGSGCVFAVILPKVADETEE